MVRITKVSLEHMSNKALLWEFTHGIRASRTGLPTNWDKPSVKMIEKEVARRKEAGLMKTTAGKNKDNNPFGGWR